MRYSIQKLFTLLFILFSITNLSTAQIKDKTSGSGQLESGLEMLKRYFYGDSHWYIARTSIEKDVKGIIDFVENEPIDSIIRNLNQSFQNKQTFVFRLPEDVADSLKVPGFYPHKMVVQRIEAETVKLKKEFSNRKARIPDSAYSNLDEKLKLIPQGKGNELFNKGVFAMPENLVIPEVIPDSLLNSELEFNRLVKIDSLREVYIEQKRVSYNDSMVAAYINGLQKTYLQNEFEQELNYQVRRLTDSVKVNNYNLLRDYNEIVVSAVNDSITSVLRMLAEYADYIDSTEISIFNLTGTKSDIKLKNGSEHFARVWLKNIQNDSLGILVRSTDKKSFSMLIDDGVTFSRYKPKETKDFDFRQFQSNTASSLTKVGNTYKVETPWIIGGDGNIGFSQTFLSNWEKGGQSAISSLIVLKGFANYKREDGMIKWENSGEFRNGLIYQGGDQRELQKNDDKFELTSRFGVSAFKKWYYTSEFNVNTQFFKAFNYPKKNNPIPYSAFLAPVRTFFKLGMEYKPNKDFSLLLSPLTVKNVYVRDTAMIEQTRFGIEADRKSFWEPGLNADIYFKKTFSESVVYETKYKMFMNYKNPFHKQDINWENTVSVKLNEFINMRFLLQLIYDDDVKFPIYDESNVKIGEKSKLQVKEFFSIGFAYKINHKLMNSKRIR